LVSARKKVVFITGTRADYGKIKPLIREMEQAAEFESAIFVTGMHMLARYGYTYIEIQKDGFSNIFTYINQVDTVNSQMDLVLANTVQGLGYYIREYPPDMIVVHGDRVETLAGAIVGALNNILVAHIEGGELSGTIDELIRHSVSKLSHLHFVSNEEARRRLIQLGEIDESIFVIGSPDIDIMLSDNLPGIDKARDYYQIEFSEYAIFTYHPVTTELKSLRVKIQNVVDALRASDRNYVVIFPNNDLGSDIIMDTLIQCSPDRRFRLLPSMRFEFFLTLLKNAQAIVGNSSAGIREAPVYGIPTINIGTRQMNRFNSSSILNVREDVRDILKALNNLPPRFEPSLHFGKGKSSTLFMEQLQKPTIWLIPQQKQFCDVELNGRIRV
jgi:UDP-N-acetylglucosamine 2-epimerase (hydrolysing)